MENGKWKMENGEWRIGTATLVAAIKIGMTKVVLLNNIL
jgi:hypothetical protein